MNFLRLALTPVAMLTGGLLLISSASAAPVGNLNTGSSGTVTVTLNSITFNPDPAAIGGGNADVATGTSLSFAGCSGVLGSPGCLSTQEGVTVFSPLTASTPLPVTNFLTFAAHPNLVYSMTSIGPGSANTNCAAANANGLSCSVFAGSPIILQYLNGGTSASFAVAGKASDTGTGGLASGSNYQGSFSDTLNQPLPNGAAPTPLNIQLYFCPSGTCTAADFSANRSITTPQSGTFYATLVPEPSGLTLGFCGAALLGLSGLVGRVRNARKSA